MIQNDEHEPIERLSSDGMQRRDAMLGDLVHSMERLHHRRRVRRTMTTAAIIPALLISTIALWWLTTARPGTTPKLVHEHDATGPESHNAIANNASDPRPAAIIVRVETDHTIVDRWKTSATVSPQSFVVDDDALLAALNEIDRPAGLIRSQGRVWLTAPVTDEAINASQHGS